MKPWTRDFLFVIFGLVLLASLAMAIVFTEEPKQACVWQPCVVERGSGDGREH